MLPSIVCSIISLPTTPMGVVGKSVHDMLSTCNYSIQPLRVIKISLPTGDLYSGDDMSIYHMYTCMSPAVPHQFTDTVGGQLWCGTVQSMVLCT